MESDSDRMFCHACGGVWLKDEAHGLTCPHCESDFTEIVEIPPDIPPDSPPEHAASLSQPRVSPWGDHNPWGIDEELPGTPSRDIPSGFHRTYTSPDGRFTFSSTTLGTGHSSSPRAYGSNAGIPMMMQNFDSIIRGLVEPTNQPARGLGLDDNFNPSPFGWPDYERVGDHQPGPASPDLSPRNADAPQPRAHQPVGLADLIEAIRADLGTPTTRATRRDRQTPNPLAILSALLNMSPNGDAVYSQEELDRVITSLIENTGPGTAPPPASGSAIRSLPKRKVDRDMMGPENNAECSICMDAVELGTEVTVLPCEHWFHFTCIEAWLIQHNTCPHCRRSISQRPTHNDGTSDNPVVIPDSPEQPRSRRRLSSARTTRSGRSSLSSLQSRLSPRLSPRRSPTPEGQESNHAPRRSSRSEGSNGGFTSWVMNRFGSST
ncbi:hypothetical protein N7499_003827 [Penicillium canescens]|uniref:RING-type E3 ubiquitin transferase n=1 Tax=Penicillium canescens TaxID=5083 RepID=A0AAD6NDH8_PENCN|nr:uncharacterized protein N7446_007334 [Penicillium canescens]KAJ5991411.1 hypothetical protein N7522_011618 [Penicillium canescens]KAJ6049336.1 hypothetical protein N7444_006052 [Penicillium canescens]KAJ6052691.1 hypothetical protein N7460_003225 [Penicillium canescens]KAJ6063214.1 hypothetical protein N7446_007334 [Penicillium canescens]KAJ6088980.1 hypothetical protein N7499_003827 [Penicillium canescens]